MSTQQLMRNRYMTDAVGTMSPAKLVTMLYDALLHDFVSAEQAIAQGDIEATHNKLVHAQDIVHELALGLKDDAWAGAAGLAQVYSFLADQLVAANVHKDVERVVACRRLVEPLAEAWHEAARSLLGAGG